MKKVFSLKITADGDNLTTERTSEEEKSFGTLEIIGLLEYEKQRYVKQLQDSERPTIPLQPKVNSQIQDVEIVEEARIIDFNPKK